MIEIRPISKKDFKTIQEIASKSWETTYRELLSEEQYDYMLDKMYSLDALLIQTDIQNHEFILALEDKKALGFASYEINYDNKRKTKIHKLYILPDQQKKGVGKLLIDEVTDIAKSHKESIITLNVNRFNKALNFYNRIGFEIIGEEDINIGNGYLMEDYILEKKL